jgi:RNA polymerase sigma factor (sigma-70 family)
MIGGGCGGHTTGAPGALLRSRTVADFEPAAALALAAGGDQQAWDSIVTAYGEMVWGIARGYRLSGPDAADVVQATWLKLVEHVSDIREGDRLGAWLATTTRREALGLLRRSKRDIPVEDAGLTEADDRETDGPEQRAMRNDEDRMLWKAFGRLNGPCQRLLRVLMLDPAPPYVEVAAVLDMPVGSIGPTRARCLSTLRGFLKDTP